MQNIRKNEHLFNINMESCLTIGVANKKGQNTWPQLNPNQPNGAQRFRLRGPLYLACKAHRVDDIEISCVVWLDQGVLLGEVIELGIVENRWFISPI